MVAARDSKSRLERGGSSSLPSGTMKLFLTSSGLSNENENDFLNLLGCNPKGLRVAFITTAMNPEPKEVREKYIPEDAADLEHLGMIVTYIDLENIDQDNILSVFLPFDVIYVYGGNTFYLMHYANKSGFTKYIKTIIQNKIYVGVSAGSIITGPNIEIAQWGRNSDRNIVDLKNMDGLKLQINSIMPHWNGNKYTEAQHYPFTVRYIKDGEAIIINE